MNRLFYLSEQVDIFKRYQEMMKKLNCHFQLHDFIKQKLFIENPWCGACGEANIGVFDSAEFEVYGLKFIQGYCRKCGARIVSEIIEKEILK